MPGTRNAGIRHTVFLGSQQLPHLGSYRDTDKMCSHNDEGEAWLQGPWVDSPLRPDGWGMLTTGMFSFPRRMHGISFMPQNPIVRFGPGAISNF